MISAVVLYHNQKKTLTETLRSLTWCDELIVINDASAGQVVDDVGQFGARVYNRSLAENFSSQRNFGLSKAKGNWVLFVDSDEIVSAGLRNEIQKAITSDAVVGYYLRRRDYIFGRALMHGETNAVRLLRLAKKTAGEWIRPVHEVWRVTGNTAELHSPLFHYPHPDIAQFLHDVGQYSTRNAQCFYDQGVRVNWISIVLYPLAKLFVDYILLLGFLDGMPGAIVAIMMSFHSFLTRAKLYLLWQKK